MADVLEDTKRLYLATDVAKGAFVQVTDPVLNVENQVIADKLWIKRNELWIRNSTNSGWIFIGYIINGNDMQVPQAMPMRLVFTGDEDADQLNQLLKTIMMHIGAIEI